MESLVNYSSEDEQDDYQYSKVAVRERVSSNGGGGTNSGRSTTEASSSGGGHLKRTHDHTRVGSSERDASPYRKSRDAGNERPKGGNTNYYNEDKYKIDRRSDKSKDYREKREKKDSKSNKDVRDDEKDYDNGHKKDYKRHDEQKRYRDTKRDYKRDDNDYYRDDKRYNKYDDRKSSTYPSYYKDRFNNSKSRFDDRKPYDNRFNTDSNRRGIHFDDRRKDYGGDRRNDDFRKSDRRYNEDRRTQRSYNEERSNTYRSRRSTSPASAVQRNHGNSKYNERNDEVNTKRDRKRNSKSKSRSRSNSTEKSSGERILTSHNNNPQKTPTETDLRLEAETQLSEKKTLPTARNFEALLTLPLSENAPKQPNVVVVPATTSVAAGSGSTATVQLPSYYNPNVINPNKYVEQMQKRKLLWGAKKSEDSASKWGHAQFSQDQDGKVASKFMRLMGIKNTASTESSVSSPNDNEKKSTSSTTPPNNADVKSREVMFSTMEQQYEVARQVTHTMRGVGLGFSSQPRPY